MGQIQGEAKPWSPFQPSASTRTALTAWEMLFLRCWMFFQCISFPSSCLSPSMSLVLAGAGSWAPWPDGQPQDFSHASNLPEVFLVALDLLQNSRLQRSPVPSLRPCPSFLLFSEQERKKKRIDLEERFHLFNKEAEEEGYLELP